MDLFYGIWEAAGAHVFLRCLCSLLLVFGPCFHYNYISFDTFSNLESPYQQSLWFVQHLLAKTSSILLEKAHILLISS